MKRTIGKTAPWATGVVAAGVGLTLLTATQPRARAAAAAGDPPAGAKDTLGYQDTPMLPGGKWHVHDGLRPQPKVITPGTSSTQDAPGMPPSDAIVLFDGTPASLASNWAMDGNNDAPAWTIANGAMTAAKGGIHTRQPFGDMQLHVEWRTPTTIRGNGQGRGNSGVFMMSRYELQVLDNYNNPTYPDGQAGAIYGQSPPFVNASRAPGQWQTYDVLWTAPRFNADKTVASPAYETVIHNGVVVQNHTALIGETGHRILATYKGHNPTEPIALQFHGDPISYRNIWVRPLPPPMTP